MSTSAAPARKLAAVAEVAEATAMTQHQNMRVKRSMDLGEEGLHNIPMHIRQAVIASAVAEGKLLVIHAEQVENGCVEVMHVDFVFHNRRADVVGVAVAGAALHTRTREP